MGARYYDQAVGRFTQPDPVAGSPYSPTSYNAYTYVGNNPVNLVDPSGEQPAWVVAIIVGGIVGGAVYLATTPPEDWDWKAALASMGYGAVTGGLISTYVVTALAGTSGSVALYLVFTPRSEWDWKWILASAAGGSLGGVVGVKFFRVISKLWR